jgi:putative ABC transport system permease protein
VIGVLPAGFVYPEGRPDLFIALREDPAAASRASHDRIAIARLAPGASVERASRDVERVAAALAEQYPTTNRGWTASVVSLRSDLLGEVGRRATVVLMGAVAFVLLMACLNVANLLLARGSGRRREMALRGALGAARSRLLRQLLTESLILALVGGAVGVLVAIGGVRAILAAMPADLPPVLSISVDRAVLLFALAVSIGSTIVFGLIPAVRASRAAAADLHEGGRSGMTARGGRRFGGTLVVAQTALAVVLLVGGGLMMRSVVNLQRQDLGYSPEHVLTARLSPPVGSYEGVTELATFFDAVLERVRAMPGVAAAGWIQSPPLSGSNNVNTYVVEGRGTPALDGGDPARMGYISPGYLDAVAARPLRGRDILESDREGAPRVALVNETLVRRSFGAEDPIGRALRVDEESWTIVGIVPDMRERGVNRDPEPSIYLSLAQRPVRSRTLALRVRSDPAAFAEAVQRAVQSVDPDQPIYAVQTMDELVRLRVGPFALVAGLMLAFALISLVLGAVGIYGVTAYGVGRRTGEIGVRMAIGAERGAVVRMIVAEGVRRALLGLALGVAGALLLSRAMSGLVVGVSPTDPLTIAAVVLVLFAVTLLGAWLPARRAARLDPLRALAGP